MTMERNRREFLRCACGGAVTAGILGAAGLAQTAGLPGWPARWYKRLPQKRVECQLCPKRCRVDDTERGFCGVRENHGGDYRTLVYGRPCALNMDPIEKKPLFHVLPGSWTFSLATAGCNMDCKACQNWQISQSRPEQVRSQDLPPDRVVETAKKNGSTILSFTYTEPVVYLEYVIDTARLARRQGLRSCMITGGSVEVEPLKEACQVLDAVKVDLKSFRNETYVSMCKGELKPVLRTIETARKLGKWVELVYLVIPTVNDSEAEVKAMCAWVKKTIGPGVPVHFTRFHPEYQLRHLPATPYSTLKRCFDQARAEGLHFPYVGNVHGQEGESTRCPSCRTVLIERQGFNVEENRLKDGRCPRCKTAIPGLWS